MSYIVQQVQLSDDMYQFSISPITIYVFYYVILFTSKAPLIFENEDSVFFPSSTKSAKTVVLLHNQYIVWYIKVQVLEYRAIQEKS